MDTQQWQFLAERLPGRGYSVCTRLCLWIQFEYHPSTDHVHGKHQGPREYPVEFIGYGTRPPDGEIISINVD